jgi:poly-gamma-glutamate synthesis protein (capsule biosynthesis protein)
VVARAGINVLATANNHAADYGGEGILETLRHLQAARASGLKAHAGLGVGSDRYRSDVFHIGSVSVGIAAIGKGVNPAGPDGPGQPLQASPADFERVGLSLAETGAQIRVLSVHYGEELDNAVSDNDRRRFRAVVDSGRATIVFGHHSHVAAGMERRGNALIFYGLGNFLHAGMQNMARYEECRDFGLHVRVYLWAEPGKDPVLRAVEVTPLKDMHEITRPFPMPQAQKRIEILNALSAQLAKDGGQPLLFSVTRTGSGLFCLGDTTNYGDELEARCRAHESLSVGVTSAAQQATDICETKPGHQKGAD